MFGKTLAALVVFGLASVAISVVNAASDQPLTAEEYDRVLNYLGELSKAKGIEDLWTKNQPEFQQITDDWKACAKKNRITRFFCDIDQTVKMGQSVTQYIAKADAQIPGFDNEFFLNVEHKCSI